MRKLLAAALCCVPILSGCASTGNLAIDFQNGIATVGSILAQAPADFAAACADLNGYSGSIGQAVQTGTAIGLSPKVIGDAQSAYDTAIAVCANPPKDASTAIAQARAAVANVQRAVAALRR